MKKLLLLTTSLFSFSLLISCGGNASKSPDNASSTPTVSGEEVYNRTCAACHQPNGTGIASTFPPLAKSDFIADRTHTIEQVIKGKTGEITVNGTRYNSTMPPQSLSDAEVAAVLTYVYKNFGNTGAPVTIDEVKAVREGAK